MEIKTAVILLAGFGTRCLPITKTIPKCMISILNKPVIEYIVEEAVSANITSLVFVLPKYCKSNIVKKHFEKCGSLEKFLIRNNKEYLLEKLNQTSKKIKIKCVYSSKANGTGGAVLSAKRYIKNKPFAVFNGDDLFLGQTPAIKELIELYNQTQCDILGLCYVKDEERQNYGICEGEFAGENFKISKITEKPKKTNSNYALVGRYVLSSDFLFWLKRTKKEKNGEIYLTNTMRDRVQNGICCYGKVLSSKRLDCGNKIGNVMANVLMGLEDEEISLKLADFLKNLV